MTTQVTTRWNEAVGRQFPWISEQFTVNRLTSRIKISKVSAELLEIIPSEKYGTNASGYYTHDQVKFHDENGEVLGEVSPRIRHSDANDMASDQDGETIGDRWYNLERPTAVVYLTRKTYYSGGCLSHDPDSYDLEIFKVADFDIRWWMSQRDKASDAAVRSTEQPALYAVNIYDTQGRHTHTYNLCSTREEAEASKAKGEQNYPKSVFKIEPGATVHHEYLRQLKRAQDYLYSRNG